MFQFLSQECGNVAPHGGIETTTYGAPILMRLLAQNCPERRLPLTTPRDLHAGGAPSKRRLIHFGDHPRSVDQAADGTPGETLAQKSEPIRSISVDRRCLRSTDGATGLPLRMWMAGKYCTAGYLTSEVVDHHRAPPPSMK